MERETVEGRWGQRGGPWEFNLRDLFRWCELLLSEQKVGQWSSSTVHRPTGGQVSSFRVEKVVC